MQTVTKVQIAAALIATFGFAMHGTARAEEATTGNQLGATEKQSPSKISHTKKVKIAKKGADASCKGKDGSCKGKEGSCKGKEGSCKGKAGSCKGKDGSCKGKEGSCKGKEGSCKGK